MSFYTMNLTDIQPPLRFIKEVEHIWSALAQLPRTGWVEWEIPNPETVAEHILATRVLATQWREKTTLSDEDFSDLLALIEVHDWPKAVAGDVVILGDEENVSTLRHTRDEAELKALENLCVNINSREKILILFKRYAAQADRVAILAKEFGLYQTVLTAQFYEEKYNRPGLLKEFITYTEPYITIPFLKQEFEKFRM